MRLRVKLNGEGGSIPPPAVQRPGRALDRVSRANGMLSVRLNLVLRGSASPRRADQVRLQNQSRGPGFKSQTGRQQNTCPVSLAEERRPLRIYRSRLNVDVRGAWQRVPARGGRASLPTCHLFSTEV